MTPAVAITYDAFSENQLVTRRFALYERFPTILLPPNIDSFSLVIEDDLFNCTKKLIAMQIAVTHRICLIIDTIGENSKFFFVDPEHLATIYRTLTKIGDRKIRHGTASTTGVSNDNSHLLLQK